MVHRQQKSTQEHNVDSTCQCLQICLAGMEKKELEAVRTGCITRLFHPA